MLSYSLSQLTTFAILLVNLEFQASDLRLDPLLLIFLSLYFFIGLVYLRFIASHYDIHRGGKSFKIFLFELSHVLFSDYYLA